MKTVGFVVVLYLSVIYTETVSFTSYKQNSQYVVQFQEHVILVQDEGHVHPFRIWQIHFAIDIPY
jgi:hypothetical protein